MNSHGICPNCGNQTDFDARYCEYCAIDLVEFRKRAQAAETADKESAESQEAKSLRKRYWDAYIVARTTVSVGAGIKIVGLVLGIIIFLAFFVFANGQIRYSKDAQFIGVVVGGVWGGLVWLTFYIFGVLVSAQGQILKASLDGAVNSSPFLTNEQRAKIMSL